MCVSAYPESHATWRYGLVHLEVFHGDEAVLWSQAPHRHVHVDAVHRHCLERLVGPACSTPPTKKKFGADTAVSRKYSTGNVGEKQRHGARVLGAKVAEMAHYHIVAAAPSKELTTQDDTAGTP